MTQVDGDAAADAAVTWRMLAASLRRPYRVDGLMVLFVSLVPLYIFIAQEVRSRPLHTPMLPLDRVIAVRPAWAIVYGALYLFLILLPVFVVRQEAHIRRTVVAYLMVWGAAYVCFLLYPTASPRPRLVPGNGFGAWGLRLLYSADPPVNCFPSLHVAHSFVSAFACGRVHRRLGWAATAAAVLVGISTLYTRQHYILDVLAGAGLAALAWGLVLRHNARAAVPEREQRVAPAFAYALALVISLLVGCSWLAYGIGLAV